MPAGVVIPKAIADVEATLAIAREHRMPITPRGGGTSQCGQTVGSGVVAFDAALQQLGRTLDSFTLDSLPKHRPQRARHRRDFGRRHARVLRRAIPQLHVRLIHSGCCGMRGHLGHESAHHDISLRIAE